MKQFLPFLLLIMLLQSNFTSAQCTPDPNCTDSLNPGEICPEILPDGTVGVPYSQVVTIIPPYEADLGSGTVTIHHITLTGVDNLPPGLTYQESATDMYPYNSYCVLVSGTPTTEGTYNLAVRVIPYIDVFGSPVAAPEQTDDTSLVIVINAASGVYDNYKKGFSLVENIPNPFYSYSKIGFYDNKSEPVELKIFNVLGEEVYSEELKSHKGENYFRFRGMILKKGIYVFSVSNGNKIFTKRLIKKS